MKLVMGNVFLCDRTAFKCTVEGNINLILLVYYQLINYNKLDLTSTNKTAYIRK